MSRYILKPSVSNDKFSFYDNNNWYIRKKDLLNIHNNTCCYCDQSFNEGLKLIQINYQIGEESRDEICCDFCHIVNNINKKTENAILILSIKKQKIIVKRTLSYYKKHNYLPLPNIIDPEAKRINLSILEFSYIIRHYQSKNEPLPLAFKKYKIFFPPNAHLPILKQFNIILNDYGSSDDSEENIICDEFGSSDEIANDVFDSSDDYQDDLLNNLSFHEFSNDELDIFNNLFYDKKL
jgi:hypothetical protein